jgi:hypothetical protein
MEKTILTFVSTVLLFSAAAVFGASKPHLKTVPAGEAKLNLCVANDVVFVEKTVGDQLFVTSDSASMISECASFGSTKGEVLMNRQLKTPNKFAELIQGLEICNAIDVFDGALGTADHKIDLGELHRKSVGG